MLKRLEGESARLNELVQNGTLMPDAAEFASRQIANDIEELTKELTGLDSAQRG
jgi:hypothetical protein